MGLLSGVRAAMRQWMDEKEGGELEAAGNRDTAQRKTAALALPSILVAL